jgi:hypothetical protein
MRAYSPASLLWQTVSVRRDGLGLLTTLIGETVGAKRRSFQLPPSQAMLVRTLVARARSVRPPLAGVAPRDTLYTLHIAGAAPKNVQGPMRRPLRALVNFLSGLMLTYCC